MPGAVLSAETHGQVASLSLRNSSSCGGSQAQTDNIDRLVHTAVTSVILKGTDPR